MIDGRKIAAVLLVMGIFAPEAIAQQTLRERIREKLLQQRDPARKSDTGSAGAATFNGQGVERHEFTGVRVAVWRPARLPAPLVIFSHGYSGINTQSRSLMSALAAAGYMVIAPNHRDALVEGGDKPSISFKQSEWDEKRFLDRGEDIARLIGALKGDTHWNKQIDWSKVALCGHSLGGYTVLALAGAWPGWKMKDIKAVVALSPYARPFLALGDITHMGVPVMYQTGTADLGIFPTLIRSHGVFDKTSSPAILVDFHNAGHFAWTNLNRDQNLDQLINFYAVSFLDKYVKGDRTAKPEEKLPGVAILKVK